jgi:hypothetical protein
MATLKSVAFAPSPTRSPPLSNPSINKRQKERQRQDKQREKEAKRQQRRHDKPPRPTAEGGVDPDIAGIIPGPQPLPEE